MLRFIESLRRVFTGQQHSEVAELVNGPHRGLFLAAYSLPVGDGFVAYAKVFRERPSDPWEYRAIAKYMAHGSCSSSALRLAQILAVNDIVKLRRPQTNG